MDPGVLVAVIASATALAVSVVTFVTNLWIARRARQARILDLVARYRDPLLWAAFDLRNTLYVAVERDMLSTDFKKGGWTWDFSRDWTLFVVSQYLGWVEIVRRGIQFLDLGDDKRNQRLVELIHEISRTLSTQRLDGADLNMRHGEQRAIGELMALPYTARDDPVGCVSFTTFSERLRSDQEFAGWFERARHGIENLATGKTARTERLVALHDRLTDLIEFLDPDAVRFPSRLRDRLTMPAPPA